MKIRWIIERDGTIFEVYNHIVPATGKYDYYWIDEIGRRYFPNFDDTGLVNSDNDEYWTFNTREAAQDALSNDHAIWMP